MQTIQMQVGTLPINITFMMDGTVALSPLRQFKTIIDEYVKLDMVGFTIMDESYEWGEIIAYKEDEKLLKWLQSLNMTMPSFQQNHFGFTF